VSTNYERDILLILSKVGAQGISVRLLARQVYNLNCTLFAQPLLADVHRSVQQYLTRCSRSRQSLVERAGKRGYYRLSTAGSMAARQLLLSFGQPADDQDDEPTSKPPQDGSLSLF
jgi:hypothetical protein